MKKTILIAGISILSALNTNAQVLYSENFDNLTIGNVGTDVTGQTPGQGGWYTHYTTQNGSSCFQIVNEPSKGKVISIQSAFLNAQANTILKKYDINLLINNRNQNYNIIKLELDFYTGNKYTVPVSSSNLFFGFTDSKNPGISIAGFNFFPATGHLKARFSTGVGQNYSELNNYQQQLILPFNTWVKLAFYLDYDNKKIYYEIPAYNIVVKNDFLNIYKQPDYFSKFIPERIQISTSIEKLEATYKFDNVKITALNNIPLSVSEFLNEKFNVFPNPATNIVNITNDDNITVDKISIYDVSGKLIKEINYNAENTIQLNIENLQSRNYLLHIETNLGTAVKKIIKQ